MLYTLPLRRAMLMEYKIFNKTLLSMLQLQNLPAPLAVVEGSPTLMGDNALMKR